jgi:hypothetical protein
VRSSSAWICDLSSTPSTIACADGSRDNPTTSRTLASSSGSLKNLKASVCQGLTSCSAHTRATVLWLIPAGRPATDVTSGHPKLPGPILWILMPSE